ncbi:hypothetical protein WICPIJ_002148 [Wickerhamomyces pijperi]|uniref:Zn(2)-C6 fungal-type domain-containing protein n=1 Tax=Wickerhamomyces pijperi TaxID=599730 RepID=A0A9P8TP83_WICPI|nr:hypothetical protein WICPIJ_002148 [Wickerhamomyces pijperi]
MSAKRTRTGCLCCRRRHKKCDELKPSCQFCLSKGIQCEWPKKGSVFVNYQTTNELSLPENTGVSFMTSSFVLDTFDTSTSKIITRSLPQQERTVRKRSASAPKPRKSSFDSSFASASSLPSRGPFNPHYSISITTTSPSPTPTPPSCTSSPPTDEANTSSISSISQDSNSPKSTPISHPPFNFNYSFNTTESSIQPPPPLANPALGTPLAYQNQYYQQTSQFRDRHNSLPPLRDLYYGLIQPPPIRDSIQAVTQSTLANCSLISTSSTNSANSGVKKFSVDSLLN